MFKNYFLKRKKSISKQKLTEMVEQSIKFTVKITFLAISLNYVLYDNENMRNRLSSWHYVFFPDRHLSDRRFPDSTPILTISQSEK